MQVEEGHQPALEVHDPLVVLLLVTASYGLQREERPSYLLEVELQAFAAIPLEVER